MGDGKPFTIDQLQRSLYAKTREWASRAEDVAQLIASNQLDHVIAGRHDSKPVTFAKGFELVFGERLTLKGAA